MTVAALKSSAFCNGVSVLHAQVSREMWHNIWPNLPSQEAPIRAITNGVHPASWISHDMKELYESYFGPRFIEQPGAPEVWAEGSQHSRRRTLASAQPPSRTIGLLCPQTTQSSSSSVVERPWPRSRSPISISIRRR